jgi:hypothetical protein
MSTKYAAPSHMIRYGSNEWYSLMSATPVIDSNDDTISLTDDEILTDIENVIEEGEIDEIDTESEIDTDVNE